MNFLFQIIVPSAADLVRLGCVAAGVGLLLLRAGDVGGGEAHVGRPHHRQLVAAARHQPCRVTRRYKVVFSYFDIDVHT